MSNFSKFRFNLIRKPQRKEKQLSWFSLYSRNVLLFYSVTQQVITKPVDVDVFLAKLVVGEICCKIGCVAFRLKMFGVSTIKDSIGSLLIEITSW